MSEEVKADSAQDTTKADAAPADGKATESVKMEDKLFDSGKKEEAKPEAQAKGEQENKTDAGKPEEAKKVVPEKYDLKLPDDSPLDPSIIETVASFAKKHGLSNEEAQKFLEEENAHVSNVTKANAEAWKKQVMEDKEIGGEGVAKNVELAHRVIKRFGSEGLMKELNRTGYGNHPEVVRLLVKIGKSMSEDQFVMPGTQNGKSKRAIEDVFYPSNNKED